MALSVMRLSDVSSSGGYLEQQQFDRSRDEQFSAELLQSGAIPLSLGKH